MSGTGLKFIWENGSKNSNAIALFRQKNIAYEYNKHFDLTADFYGIGLFEKVCFEPVEGNVFEICRM